MQGYSMTSGAPWKHIIKFSLPVLAGSLLQQLYNTVDTIIVGKYSSQDALSAVGTTGTFAFFFLAIAIGLSAGNGVVIARYYGAEDEKNVRKNASSGILFLMTLGVISAVLGIVLSKPAFRYLVSVPEEILDLTVLYFRIYAVGLIFQFGYNIFSSILRAIGDSNATLYFLLISSAVNIGLDLLFVKTFDWGVAGAAIATDISQLISLIAAYIYMRKKYSIFRFKFSEYKWRSDPVKETIKIGMPISLQLIIVSIGLTFIQRAANEFGKIMTASFTVGQRIEQYINLPCNSLQTTLATYTAQNVGAKKIDRIKKGAKQCIAISVGMTLIVSAVIWLFAKNIAGLFGLSDDAMSYCIPTLKTIAIINMVLSAYVPLFGLYQGTGHSAFPAVVATTALTIRVSSVYILRYSAFLGHSIIWWNGIFGFSAGFIITWSYYLSKKWLNKCTEEKEDKHGK